MYTYIIVDDEVLTRKGTIKKLSPLADTIQCIGEASNGSDALSLMELVNPDIIITDMNMPVLNGLELLPILTEKYPEKRIIVISGYKNFEYTKQAIRVQAVDYILKPFGKAEIQKAILYAIHLIEDKTSIQKQIVSSEMEKEYARYEYDIQILKNILLGYHTLPSEITSTKLQFMNQTHNFIVITLHSSDCLQKKILQNFLQENGFGDLALYLSHDHNNQIGFFIIFVPERAVLNAHQLCLQIIHALLNLFQGQHANLSFGISNTHDGLMNLHKAFMETVSALNSKKVNQVNCYYFYENQVSEPSNIQWAKEEELMFRIESGMVDQVVKLLDELFDYFQSNYDYTLYGIKYYCFQLSSQTKKIMAEYFDQVRTNSLTSSTQNILNNIFTLTEIKNYYVQSFCNISEILKEKSVYATNDIIEKLKIYVQRNYQNNLTLEYLSSLFYMNRSYCSHIFKEKTGENFVDYVNKVRIEKAKLLLSNSDKKMYLIAKSAGYDNVKYFFRIFKKLEGVTPEQFRSGRG